MRIIFSFLILYYSCGLLGQTSLTEVYKQKIEAFNAHQNMAYRMDYALYKPINAEEPAHRLQMDIWKQEEQVYLKFEDYEIYQNKQYNLYIDHYSKSILIQTPQAQFYMPMDWEAFTEFLDYFGMESREVAGENGHRIIRFQALDRSATKTEIEFDPTTDLLHRMVAVIDLSELEDTQYELDQSKMEVHFSRYQLKNVVVPKQLKDILRSSKGGFVGVGAYEQYEVQTR